TPTPPSTPPNSTSASTSPSSPTRKKPLPPAPPWPPSPPKLTLSTPPSTPNSSSACNRSPPFSKPAVFNGADPTPVVQCPVPPQKPGHRSTRVGYAVCEEALDSAPASLHCWLVARLGP